MKQNSHACRCNCCTWSHAYGDSSLLNRRDFLFRVGAATAGGMMLSAWDGFALEKAGALPVRGPMARQPLRVQPVLTHDLPKRREATSWRGWGGIQNEADALAEKNRIESELKKLKAKAGFAIEILPTATVHNLAQTASLGNHDVVIIFAAGGGLDILEKLAKTSRFSLMFLRHDPGPAYLWYEIVHPRFLRKTVDEYAQSGLDVHDVVVDDWDDLLWRMRALHGLKDTLGKRIVAIGGAGGWGAGGQKAPDISRNLWKLDIVDLPYKDLEPRLKSALANTALVASCREAARLYLRQPRTSLHTAVPFVENAFVLNEVFKDVLDEAKTDALTIQHCMGTIMGISKTTACLPLSLLNDDGYQAFCESDFVVIPSGILLHNISGLPVFLNDPTTPHKGVVTLAHCTAPRKMDGKRSERAKILTHFESDYGAAPKVEMKLGQVCTNLVPDFNCKKWVGFEGRIIANPFHDICRSQIDVRIAGDDTALLEEMKGFHWMMSYGDYLRETGYALRKLGVEFHNVSAQPSVPKAMG